MDFFEQILNNFELNPNDADKYSPLVLAYIGDAVYEIFIRTFVICKSDASVSQLHRNSVEFVKAKTQSDIINKITPLLSQKEQHIVRRGRNAKSGTLPKNASYIEYKYATGFECLIGFLYLKRNFPRLIEILKLAIQST